MGTRLYIFACLPLINMRNSRVILSSLHNQLVPLTSFSNQILYPYNPNQNFFYRIVDKAYTKFYLSQAKSYFPDFFVSEFASIAQKIYLDAGHCAKGKKKTELNLYVTPPIADMIKISLKNHFSLPFIFHSKIKSVKIEHARISTDSGENALRVNFLHITTRVLLESQDEEQLVTFERRLDDKFRDSWRICFVEDVKKSS